jgi:hypothetical protein
VTHDLAALHILAGDEAGFDDLWTFVNAHQAEIDDPVAAQLCRGQNYAALALASHRLGRHEEAREYLAQAKSWLTETNQAIAKNKFGYAASDYLTDWLSALVLIREAEQLLAHQGTP